MISQRHASYIQEERYINTSMHIPRRQERACINSDEGAMNACVNHLLDTGTEETRGRRRHDSSSTAARTSFVFSEPQPLHSITIASTQNHNGDEEEGSTVLRSTSTSLFYRATRPAVRHMLRCCVDSGGVDLIGMLR